MKCLIPESLLREYTQYLWVIRIGRIWYWSFIVKFVLFFLSCCLSCSTGPSIVSIDPFTPSTTYLISSFILNILTSTPVEIPFVYFGYRIIAHSFQNRYTPLIYSTLLYLAAVVGSFYLWGNVGRSMIFGFFATVIWFLITSSTIYHYYTSYQSFAKMIDEDSSSRKNSMPKMSQEQLDFDDNLPRPEPDDDRAK